MKILKKLAESPVFTLVFGLACILIILASMKGISLPGFLIVVAGEIIYGYNLYVMKNSWSIKIKKVKLINTGFFKYIRHPLYLGVIIAFYGLSFTFKSLTGFILTTIAVVPFFYCKAKIEEEFLKKNMKGYKEYMKRTGMFFPKIKNNNTIKMLVILLCFIIGCTQSVSEQINRYDLITGTKVLLENDYHQLILHSSDYEQPIPLPYPVSTAGGEDSAFILPHGNTLYFWFTPDVNISPEKQVIDKVTGIYVSHKFNGNWSEPERIILQEEGKLALDGCAFIAEDIIWFCSAREGYEGVNWFIAEFDSLNNKWFNVREAGFPEHYEVGELHLHGDELYFHSYREGGKGGMDVWVMIINPDGSFSEPVNVESVNSERDEGFPAISPDGEELWISRDYGLWRSKRVNNIWGEPELIISNLAGEASIDNEGNLYFTHHYYNYETDLMLEADIYTAFKR